MQQALRFHEEPEFRVVGGETVGKLRSAVGSHGGQVDTAVFFDDAAVLAGRAVALCVVDGHAQLTAQHIDAHPVGIDALIDLRLHAVVGLVGGVEDQVEISPLYETAEALERGDGIIEEAEDLAGDVADKSVLDAAIIAAAQAVEHYEITRYGTLITWAKTLGYNDGAAVLKKTLDEEKAADQKLSKIAESSVNLKAA